MYTDPRYLSPSERFLIGCSCFPNQDNGWMDSVCLDCIDWDEVISMALEHRMLEFVIWYMRHYDLLDLLSIDSKELVIQKETEWSNRSSALSEEIARVFRRASLNGYKIVFLKGVALTALVYGIGGIRRFWDMDILVSRTTISGFYDFIHDDLGYTCKANEATRKIWAMTSHEYAVSRFEGRFCIDLHQYLSHPELPFRVDPEEVIDAARMVDYGITTEIRIPSLDDLLIHLCLHLYQHHAYMNDLFSLRNHADIRNFILAFTAQIDWSSFLAKVSKWKAEIGVTYALYHTEGIYGNLLPTGVLSLLMTKDIVREIEAMRASILCSHEPIGYWRIPYLRRLFDFYGKPNVKRLIQEAIVANIAKQTWLKRCESLGLDPKQIQGVI